ncbi:predicted protein [Sparassis crispa]|uniref:F-box domain-containing protein n=1 Tax=Sparassis crispa TaxID=139825 RepID=A0A401GUE3_9APHY|nr:predicted protein [Sparassis crispa]GBE85847.1 predicted protein [Sparassis crispa]
MVEQVSAFKLPQSGEVASDNLSSEQTCGYFAGEKDETTQNLNALHNSFAAVNHLPNELLVEIFSYVNCDDSMQSHHMLLNLTMVCHYWREVSIMAPKLWTNIEIPSNLDLLRLQLQRSCDAPVKLSYKGIGGRHFVDDNSVCRLMDMISPHASHIYSLHLSDFFAWYSAPSSSPVEMVLAALDFPMPELEALSFVFVSTQSAPVPFEPASDQFPRLRSLSLSGVYILWTSALLQNLVFLAIQLRDDSFDPQGRLYDSASMDTVLNALEACLSLEDLKLIWCGPKVPDTSNPARFVSLPRLQRLSLEDNADTLSALLSHLIIPPQATITAVIDGPLPMGWRGSRIGSISPQDDPLRDPTRHIPSNQLVGAYDSPDCSESSVRLEMRCNFIFPDWMPEELNRLSLLPIATREFTELFASIGAPVSTLRVFGFLGFMRERDWVDALACFPHLKHLGVGYAGNVCALFHALDIRMPPRPPRVVCPHLQVLDLDLVNTSASFGQHSAGALLACLRSRARVGARLKRLRLKGFDAILYHRIRKMMKHLVDKFSFVADPGC